LCADNAAMIAHLGARLLQRGLPAAGLTVVASLEESVPPADNDWAAHRPRTSASRPHWRKPASRPKTTEPPPDAKARPEAARDCPYPPGMRLRIARRGPGARCEGLATGAATRCLPVCCESRVPCARRPRAVRRVAYALRFNEFRHRST